MNTSPSPRRSLTQRSRRTARLVRSPALKLSVLAAAISLSTASYAIDFGPFSLNGFAKAEVQSGTNNCSDCQWSPGEDRQRYWADPLIPGAQARTRETHVTLVQPYLGVKIDLGKGYKLSGLLSQRFRDGKPDIGGFWYDKNLALSHEDYGSIRMGAMTTRAWSVADYPYGTNIGIADVWGSSGAGYGLLTNAIRYTSRVLDVAQGDLVLEATYDRGDTRQKINKPSFLELYAQYHQGDLVIDAMMQTTRNGKPSSWSHGPFKTLTDSVVDDAKLGSSGQSIAMAMARYQVDRKIEVSGGIRRNSWSGAYATVTVPGGAVTPVGPKDVWNYMFNVDWTTSIGGTYRGYPATSTDWMVGARYRMDKWVAYTGMAHLGKAKTANPTERGQSNSATVNTVGLKYEYGQGIEFYGFAGMIRYGRLGLAPLSMPGNAAFTNVDSRVSRNGNWFGAGAVYVF